MALAKILLISIVTGGSLVFAVQSTYGTSGAGYAPLLNNFLLSDAIQREQGWILLVSLVLAVSSIFGLAKFITNVYEYKISGIATALLGIFGSFLLFSSSQENMSLIILGVGFWIIGAVIVFVQRKKRA